MPSNPRRTYSSIISLTRPRLAAVVVMMALTRSRPSASRTRLIPVTVRSWESPPGLGRLRLCKSAGPSREVEIRTLWALQQSNISSEIRAKFVAMTNARSRVSILFIVSACSTMYCIRPKLRSGSPPWNSILIEGDGDLNVKARALSAVSFDMSNGSLSSFCRDT